MKKILISILLITTLLLPQLQGFAVNEQYEFIYMPTDDTYVYKVLPDDNYGEEVLAKNDYQQSFISYLAFDLSGKTSEPKMLEEPNPTLGSWFEYDITALVKTKLNQKLGLMLGRPYIKNSDESSAFYTKEAEINHPHLKVILSSDKKTVVSAKLYLFGGSGALYNVNGKIDEKTMTYKTRPIPDDTLGIVAESKINPVMSGNEEDTGYAETIEGKNEKDLATTTMTSFASAMTDYAKWTDVYDASKVPDVNKLLEDYKKTVTDVKHPRTLGNYEDWQRVRRLYKENEDVKKWAEYILTSADRCLTGNLPEYKLKTNNQLQDSGSAAMTLAMAYQITLDEKYAGRAYEYAKAVAEFPNWNHNVTQLNTGACALNVGVAYDFIYDTMTEQERRTLINGMRKNGFSIMLGRPNENINNWNPVVNGGLAVMAIAVMDEEPYLAAEMISQSIGALPKSLMQFYPDGGFPEGPSYWTYMLGNLCNFLSALNCAFGTDYGLGDFPGLSDTGYYGVYMQGPMPEMRFTYGDDRSKYVMPSAMFYLAKRYNNKVFSDFGLNMIRRIDMHSVLAPYWFTDETLNTDEDLYAELKKDRAFDGQMPVGSLRSAWNDDYALFAGFKGGYPQVSHSDLDIGTFAISALGEEWAIEPKVGDYGRNGYPSLFRLSRYMYYAASPQGHNTLIFNPGKTYPSMEFGQDINGYAKITELYSGDNSSYGIIDMSPMYKKHATSVKRGIALINNRREFLVQDEITSKKDNQVYWFMHTKKEVEIKGNTAILKEGNRKLYCKILYPENAVFTLEQARALPKTPSISGFDNNVNKDVHKLSIKTDLSGRGKITVWMVPMVDGDEIPQNEPVVTDIKSWPLKETENIKLSGVNINGKRLEDFAPDKYIYSFEDENIVVETTNTDANCKITKTEDHIRIDCTDPEGKKLPSRYVFYFNKKKEVSNIIVTAKDTLEEQNRPINTLDGDLETRWYSVGESWILYDLGEETLLESVSVAFYNGEKRRYNFNIEISVDGENYTKIFDGKSSGISAGLTEYEFDQQMVRFVRINCNGNNENEYDNISEVTFGYVLTDEMVYESNEE